MGVRTLIAAAVAIGLTGVSAGDAAAQGPGGHCGGGGNRSTMSPGSMGSPSGSQAQLTQMRAMYVQQMQLAQMRAAAAQQAQLAQMQAQQMQLARMQAQQAQLSASRNPASLQQTSLKQTTLKTTPAKQTATTPSPFMQTGPALAFGSGVTIITPSGSP